MTDITKAAEENKELMDIISSQKGVVKMKAYKGFDKDLKCRGYQYQIGGEYTKYSAELCKKGFHACELPHDVFNYYAPAESRFCEVDLDATDERNSEDSKRVGTRIKIGAEISVFDIAKISVKEFFDLIEFTKKIESSDTNNAGDYGAANAGYRGAANAGYRGAAIVRDGGKAKVGKSGVAVGLGEKAMASGAVGAVLVLTERDSRYNIINAAAVIVDGEKIKADTYYTMKNGEIVEV